MQNTYRKIADAYDMLAEGYRELAGIESEESVESAGADSVETDISIEDIRAVLAEKSQDGKRKEVKDLLLVFCKYFFQKVASNFWRMLHLQIGESCKRCQETLATRLADIRFAICPA